MFTEREQEYLKGLVLSALHIMQEHDFRSLSAAELKNEFNDCLFTWKTDLKTVSLNSLTLLLSSYLKLWGCRLFHDFCICYE